MEKRALTRVAAAEGGLPSVMISHCEGRKEKGERRKEKGERRKEKGDRIYSDQWMNFICSGIDHDNIAVDRRSDRV